MDTVAVLEELSKNTHYNRKNKDLSSFISKEIAELMQKNDTEGLNNQLVNSEFLPNESHVAQVHLVDFLE